MATHFSVLAWRIPEMGEPGGLPSMGSHRVGHNWSDLAAAADKEERVPRWHRVKNLPANEVDTGHQGSISGSGRSPRGGNGNHSSILAWKIPWTEEPGRPQSMGLLGVGHDWATLLSLFTFMHWRRKWQPIPGFLPGESQGQRSLVGCCLWGCTESDTTEAT